jgi:hypothetical protein
MVNTVFQQRRYCQQPEEIYIKAYVKEDTKDELIKFDLLKKHVIETLHTYAVFFREGEFDQLREGIDNIESLSAFMLNEKNFELSHKEYANYEFEDDLVEQYKSFLFTIVDEFKQVLRLTTLNDGLHNQVETLTESDKTLKNLDLLKEFVKKYYGGMSFTQIEVSHSLSEPLKIQQEFLVYLQRHGPPPGGIFETEKMAIIKLEIYGSDYGGSETKKTCDSSDSSDSNSNKYAKIMDKYKKEKAESKRLTNEEPVTNPNKSCTDDTYNTDERIQAFNRSIETIEKKILRYTDKLEKMNEPCKIKNMKVRISNQQVHKQKIMEQHNNWMVTLTE